MSSTRDVWVFAAAKVANKGILARIGHSARLHSMRSAVSSKGSAASKALSLAGMAGRAALNLIPIPIIGSLIASAETAIEQKIRTHYHNKKLTKNGPVTQSDFVKFSLKDISVANLDRYRFKVTDSVEQMKRAGDGYINKFQAAAAANAPCNADLELALAIAQAERRLEKFESELAGLLVILNASATWATAAKVSITDYKNQASTQFANYINAEMKFVNQAVTPGDKNQIINDIFGAHAKCNDFCKFNVENEINTNWDAFRSGAADVVRNLQEPFSAESFLTVDRSSFEGSNRVENYQAAKPS